MSVRSGWDRIKVPKHQADATLSQANPVSGTKYTVLDTTRNAEIIAISVQCTWTVQPTPLEIHITKDGILNTHAFTNPATATPYSPIGPSVYDAANDVVTQRLTAAYSASDVHPFPIRGRTIKIEAEITGGTVQNLTARVKYAKW